MPSYLYHVKLELYPMPAASFINKRRHQTARPTLTTSFVPSPGADIFTVKLPTHRVSNLPELPDTPANQSSSASQSPSPPHANKRSESHVGTLLLPERSSNLLTEPHTPASAPAKPTNELAAKDWRYDDITVESIDMEAQSSARRDQAGNGIGPPKSTVNGLHTKAVYQPSEAKTTDIGYGVVHLYRDTEETPFLGEEDAISRKSLDKSGRSGRGVKDFDPADCTTLCILAVPALTTSHLLSFLGEQAKEDVKHIRMIRTSKTRNYMVLLKFRSAKKAREWQKMNNGRRFGDFDQESCHVVFVKSVEFLSPDSDVSDANSFPRNTNDPFTPSKPAVSSSMILSSKPPPPPPPDLRELPTCPVCLERMDETTGLLTILCQHVFHCVCLEKWQGSGCPVCRYTHSPSSTFPYPRPTNEILDDARYEPLCNDCGRVEKQNLWVCVICGNVGCGRFNEQHALTHYEETSHCYAMNIETQRVWDYAGDGWVHRLIQSKPDSTPIDMPSRARHENEAFRAEGSDSVPREKMESLALEYTTLLTSQLDSQRRYFEEQVRRSADKASEASARAEQAVASAVDAVTKSTQFQDEARELQLKVTQLESRTARADKDRTKFEKMARETMSRLQEEQSMSKGLQQRITVAEERAAKAKSEAEEAAKAKAEAEDQCNDLMMMISGQQQVAALGEDVVEGTVSVPEGKKGRKKGKGKA